MRRSMAIERGRDWVPCPPSREPSDARVRERTEPIYGCAFLKGGNINARIALITPATVRPAHGAAIVEGKRDESPTPIPLARTSTALAADRWSSRAQKSRPSCSSTSVASLAVVVQRARCRRARDARDGTQILVDGAEVMVGHVSIDGPWHDLQTTTVERERN